MNKLRSNVEHRTARANGLFIEELYGVPHCFLVDWTDEMYHGSKSSIQEILSPCHHVRDMSKCHIVETSPILCKLSNVSADNFYEFAVVFYKYVIRLSEGFDRLDVVFHCYFKNSLKAQTRKGQGSSGTHVLQITDNIPFPRNLLTAFLCNTDN